MKVRYTPDVFRFQVAGGVSRYFVELSKELQALSVDARIVAGLHINDLVADAPRSVGVDVRSLSPARARQAVTKLADYGITAGVIERLGQGDIVHPTWYPPGLARLPRRARLITTVFDMIPERFPGLSVRGAEAARRKRSWVGASDHVLVISQNTRRDLVEIHGVDPAKVTVTPLGVTVTTPTPPPQAERFLTSPFLLFVGDRSSPYKNFERVLDAMASNIVDPRLRLVCVGGAPRSAADNHDLRRRALLERIVMTTGTDANLAWFYEHAAALVYPSLYEGFGLPPLEAMAYGCPVVASDASSIPEVVGDAALLVEPADAEAFAHAIAAVDGDADLRARLIRAGRLRAAGFTWRSTAEQTLEVYARIGGGS